MNAAILDDAERMDRHYRYQRYIYDATRTHYLIGRKHLIADLQPRAGGKVLEVGCGTAWNLIRAASAYPQAQFYGLDISEAMLETARTSIRRKGLDGRIALAQADATRFRSRDVFACDHFDRVFFSYTLSMIPGWHDALARGAASVGSGGSLHIADFGQCEGLPVAVKRALFGFLRHYTVTPRADLEVEVAKIALDEGMSFSFTRLHRGYTQYAVLRRA